MKTIKELAQQVARGLGVPVYIRGDKIFQQPPGEKIDPPSGATLGSHGDKLPGESDGTDK